MTEHHLIERGSGGEDTLENLVLLCAYCHHLIHDSGGRRDYLRDREKWVEEVFGDKVE